MKMCWVFCLLVTMGGLVTSSHAGPAPGMVVAQASRVPTQISYEVQRPGGMRRGSFTRLLSGDWMERNGENPKGIMFASVSESADLIVLHDRSRNLSVQIDLRARIVRIRQGNAAWQNFYTVTGFR